MKRWLGLSLAASLALGGSTAALAQSGGRDRGAIQFRLGGYFPSGGDDFWEATEESFTLTASDFNGVMIGGSYVAALNNYLELGVNFDLYEQTESSATRDGFGGVFVDEFFNPYLHDTSLGVYPLTVDLRLLPAGRYARRGAQGQHLVRRPVPYLGAGVGVVFWSYEEVGQFIGLDEEGYFEFYDELDDDGVEPEFHVLGGIEVPVGQRWSLVFEGRYSWADAVPSGRFTELQQGNLELGGWAMSAGASCRF